MTRPLLLILLLAGQPVLAAKPLQLLDVFDLEFVSDPQISPDGKQVIYVRNSMDIMKDRVRGRLWTIDVDGDNHRPLLDDEIDASQARWSPDGKRLAYVVSREEHSELVVRWVGSGESARVAQLDNSPGNLAWSPDGRQLAFTAFVDSSLAPFVTLPAAPKGAEWAKPARVIDRAIYRRDGAGYVKDGYQHIFVVSAEGGRPRQLTGGNFHHRGRLAWSHDSQSIVFSAPRREDWEFESRRSELFEIEVSDGNLAQLTDRRGPDTDPTISPDGKLLAWIGYDDGNKSYHVPQLYVMKRNGKDRRVLTAALDRPIQSPAWADNSSGVFVQYEDQGLTRVALIDLKGQMTPVASNVGGTTIGRPYSSGSFSVSRKGLLAYTQTRPDHPADLAVTRKSKAPVLLTRLNEDLLSRRQLGDVEEIRYKSSFDKRSIHGWVVKPPGFDPKKTYPVLLEIHGGPFANYGERFSVEVQLYAAAGYLVLYTNPRGSTGYGQAFADLIDHNYPCEGDFQDMMSGLDELIRRGWADPRQQYITGGSGGGILTAWVVGKTQRFRAAVAQKPVINWYSFVGATDIYTFVSRYWFGSPPWEDPRAYEARSPLSLVGKVTTPTMLMTGEEDYRTPISESEQFYHALKLRRIDTMLVRIPGASHAIVKRPSRLMVKVAHILKWFEVHAQDTKPSS